MMRAQNMLSDNRPQYYQHLSSTAPERNHITLQHRAGISYGNMNKYESR